MNNQAALELRKAAALTFEELGFLFPSDELDENQRNASTDIGVTVGFRGPFSGRLVLRLTRELLPIIAANMLGEPEPPEESLCRDAAGEVANVVCGNALPNIAGSRAVFDLDGPQVCDGWARPSEEPAAQTSVGLEQGRVDVMLFMDT